ncbi:hypothetical protein D3273_16590 [Lichenibacterium minor]|uniref:Tc1-like transposase DDE domain-containing protein n=1 Tax=Lichenibacterium minor TaxID=2316528 RepID=A0A4Q2U6U5_9HYPH|nr:hypothetical protein D3273_16590 [Lichenibacterium minor]
MDDRAAHKVAGVRQTIEAAGAQLRYLPACSPDFEPIERAFAKLEALLRTAAGSAPAQRFCPAMTPFWVSTTQRSPRFSMDSTSPAPSSIEPGLTTDRLERDSTSALPSKTSRSVKFGRAGPSGARRGRAAPAEPVAPPGAAAAPTDPVGAKSTPPLSAVSVGAGAGDFGPACWAPAAWYRRS